MPKLRLLPVTAAHSPLAFGFSRSQLTTRSPLPPAATAAFQPRFATLRTIVAPGFVDVYGESFAAYARYLPQFILSAVFPLPKTSYATPTRGVRSLYASTPFVSAMVIGCGFRNDDLPNVPFPSTGA